MSGRVRFTAWSFRRRRMEPVDLPDHSAAVAWVVKYLSTASRVAPDAMPADRIIIRWDTESGATQEMHQPPEQVKLF